VLGECVRERCELERRVDSCLEGKEKRGLENVRGRRRRRTSRRRETIVPNLPQN
jgi:hypothetical protein